MQAQQLLAPRRAVLPSARQARRCARLRVFAMSSVPDQFWGKQFTVLSTSEDATAHLASALATDLRAGDAYCLKGDAGAGKTAFRWDNEP